MSAALLVVGQYAGAITVTVAVIALMWRAVKAYNRFEERHANLEKLLIDALDKLAVMGSLQDLIDQPLMILDQHGQVVSINMACHRLLGYSAEELKNGSWKPKLDWNAQVDWEQSIRDSVLFDRVCDVAAKGRRIRVTIIAKPTKRDGRLLGWRCSIDLMRDGEAA